MRTSVTNKVHRRCATFAYFEASSFASTPAAELATAPVGVNDADAGLLLRPPRALEFVEVLLPIAEDTAAFVAGVAVKAVAADAPLDAGVAPVAAVPDADTLGVLLAVLLAAAPDGIGVVAAELGVGVPDGVADAPTAAASFSSLDGVEARESTSLPLELVLSVFFGLAEAAAKNGDGCGSMLMLMWRMKSSLKMYRLHRQRLSCSSQNRWRAVWTPLSGVARSPRCT